MNIILTLLFSFYPTFAKSKGNEMIQISRLEAAEKKFPAVEITLSIEKTGFSVIKFPDHETLLRLAGPPGGPLSVEFKGFKKALPDGQALKNLILDFYGQEKALIVTEPEILKLNGIQHSAISYLLHSNSPKRAEYCAILYLPAEARAEAVVVIFESGAGKALKRSCAEILKVESLRTVLDSLQIKF